MLTKVDTSSGKKEKTTQSLFSRRWADIEKKQKRNKNFEKKRADLFARFQQDILPEEQKMCELIAEETHHLISFMAKKSFTLWQREELSAWIEDNLDTLCHHPFGDNNLGYDLRKVYNDALESSSKKLGDDVHFSDEELEEMRELTQVLFKGKKEFNDDELSEFLRNPNLFEQHFKDFIESGGLGDEDEDDIENSATDDVEEDEEHDDFFNDFHQQFGGGDFFNKQKISDKNQKLKSLFDASELNKLYKMLANRLHPDKERNQHLKAKKSELMAQLAHAKKNKDAFVIISMFQEYFPNHDLSLNDDLDAALSGLLQEKLRELDDKYYSLRKSDGVLSMIWSKLGGRSKKIITENMAHHLLDLKRSKNKILHTVNSVKTVKVMKEQLSQRYEQRSFSPITTLSELFGGDMPFDMEF